MDNQTSTLQVEVRRVCFSKQNQPGKHWVILSTDKGTCKGGMSWIPEEREKIEITGSFKAYQGVKEFSFTLARPVVPTGSRQLLTYTCSKALGFGHSLEEKIWAKYGEEWKTVAKFDIAGVTDEKMGNFNMAKESISRNQLQADTVAWLMDNGVTQNMCDKAWELWKEKTMPTIKNDPYSMVELPRVGFLAVDKVRLGFAILDDDPRRIRAGVKYAMEKIMQGATVCHYDELITSINNETLRNVSTEKITKIIGQMLLDGDLVGFETDGMIATKRDYANELAIWEYAKCA